MEIRRNSRIWNFHLDSINAKTQQDKQKRRSEHKEDKEMEFFDVVKNRRSVRNFKKDALPEGAVEKILDAARFAMSGANGQPWEFVVVTKKETRDKIADINIE